MTVLFAIALERVLAMPYVRFVRAGILLLPFLSLLALSGCPATSRQGDSGSTVKEEPGRDGRSDRERTGGMMGGGM